eukprot:m.204486 g.204486  ORF g.204486 m.204486 type:complete len:193 (-) comp18472_c1_seq1:1469-2047(-)
MAALCPGLWLRACLLPGLVCMLSLTGSDAASDTGSTTRPIKALMFVLVDDLGFNDLLGTDNISAPFVRELAQESVRLDNYYVEPVCSPARSALMAGRYPPRFGLQHQVIWSGQPAGVPLNETFFPELLSQAGWATHAIGWARRILDSYTCVFVCVFVVGCIVVVASLCACLCFGCVQAVPMYVRFWFVVLEG